MGFGWQLNAQFVAGNNSASTNDNGHDARLAYNTFRRFLLAVMQQAWLKIVDLMTGIAQAGQFNDRLVPNGQPGAGRQCQQIDMPCCYILAEFPRFDLVAGFKNSVKKLALDQVHLPKVWLLAIAMNMKKVLIMFAGMGIALHPEILDEFDRILWWLAEIVVLSGVHGNDHGRVVQFRIPAVFLHV